MSRAWLTLALTPGLNAVAWRGLVATFGSAAAVADASTAELRAAGIAAEFAEALQKPPAALIDASLQWLDAGADHFLIPWDDPRYPRLLQEIPDPPAALFVRGNPHSLGLPQLAIVGSRNASPGGAETAFGFARHLGGCGLAITSGLALGIDAAAHRGALAADAATVAVLGTGPDTVYPGLHTELAVAIAVRGALVTEFPPGTPPRRANFPQRNRIISGLSAGTLVVEAGLQSGALVTAGFARDQGREVFAIPGSIHNPLSKGCHRLIRQGAKLVETASDVLEELPELLAAGAAPKSSMLSQQTQRGGLDTLDPEYARLLDALGWDTLDVDALALRSGLTTAEVSSMLLILELQGAVQPFAGGRYQRRDGKVQP